MRQNTGTARGARVAVRLSREDRVRIDEVVKTRGYTSPSAFIRAAIENELNGRPELTKIKDLITGAFEGMSRDNIRIVRSLQALRYHLLIKAAGRSMSGDALAGLKDLVTHGTN
jgi:Arc/MetJ-type ribon-helix-helix transcriptional regulator